MQPIIERQSILLEQRRSTIDELTGLPDTSIGQAIAWIEHSRMTHQQFVDNPQFCTEGTGDVDFHLGCIDRYTEVLKVLRYYYEEISD